MHFAEPEELAEIAKHLKETEGYTDEEIGEHIMKHFQTRRDNDEDAEYRIYADEDKEKEKPYEIQRITDSSE